MLGRGFPSESESRTVLDIIRATGFVTSWRGSYQLVSELSSSLRFILSFLFIFLFLFFVKKKKKEFKFGSGSFTTGNSDLGFFFVFVFQYIVCFLRFRFSVFSCSCQSVLFIRYLGIQNPI